MSCHDDGAVNTGNDESYQNEKNVVKFGRFVERKRRNVAEATEKCERLAEVQVSGFNKKSKTFCQTEAADPVGASDTAA